MNWMQLEKGLDGHQAAMTLCDFHTQLFSVVAYAVVDAPEGLCLMCGTEN